jgi:carbamate kinase
VYEQEEADRLKVEKGWVFKLDGAKWRRVVPSPLPKRIFEIRPVKWLLEHGTMVICAGGGGIPTMYAEGKDRWLTGIEAVIDKDLASELLARELEADLLVIATDVDGVYLDWGKPEQRMLGTVTIKDLKDHPFPAGSMGPKVDAAIQFVEKTGKRAAIGSLKDIEKIVAGEAGTNVIP